MEEVCGWNLHGHRFHKQRVISGAYKQHGPTYQIYNWRCKTRWIPSLPGHNSFTTAWQLPLTSVYRKPTHIDLYLQWDSHHHPSAKFSVINTLRHRARTVCSNNQLLKEEEGHLNRALSSCKNPIRALNRANFTDKKNRTNKNKNNKNSNIKNKPYIAVPYMKGLSESCKNICRKHGIEMFFKGANTIRELLVHPKDILQKSGWFTDINVAGCTVRMSIWGSQAEHLLKDSESTWEHHHPYMTIITPLVMNCLWTITA